MHGVADTDDLRNGMNSSFVPSPVAICGIALRLPGGIRDTAAFWELLISGKDARAPIPKDRYNSQGFASTFSKKGAIESQWGYFINEDLACLDTSFFSLSKEELEKTDPQQRQLLEVTKECLESAGEVDYDGKSVGCYVGTFGEDWLRMSAKESQHSGRYTLTGYNDLMIANRVSYEYNFRGPSIVLKTGCSASLAGLHQACRALQTGDCTAALVAGTNLIMGPAMTAAMTTEGILSPEGSCKTFDAEADGFARGEAINAVYLKLLDDAITDGNPIRAVIRNTASNSDGRSTSLMAPNGLSHEDMMRKVYHDCGLDPRETPFVECHGTGTATGDPVETTAVGNVFGDQGVFIGSVKPNVGHSEGASGITSLIKAVLALEHVTIPPNIKFNRPNPRIQFRAKNLKVPTEATAWPVDRPKRISVNSFGIGGANAHAIVESYTDDKNSREYSSNHQTTTPTLLLFSANTSDSLQTRINDHEAYLKAHPERLLDMAFTLAFRREHLSHRSYMIAKDNTTVDIASPLKIPLTPPSLIMVFTGQGAQWPRMGADLMNSDPGFLDDIRSMDKVLQTSIHPPAWSIELELQKDQTACNLQKAEFAQPVCTALQIALANRFLRAGVHPAAVIGHSSGEIAAAYASGKLSLRIAILAAYYRGYVTKSQISSGRMAAVGMSRDDVIPFLRDDVVIACENSPSSVTISGGSRGVDSCITDIKKRKPEVLARVLQVDQAYHSHHMKSFAAHYLSLLLDEYSEESTGLEQSQTPFFSSVTLKTIQEADHLGPEYWQANLTSPVLFAPALSEVLRNFDQCLFLEIGAHSALAGPIRQICSKSGTTCSYVPSMLRNRDCNESLLSAFGQLFQNGQPVQFKTLVAPAQVLPDLPRYPWDHSASYWHENRLSRDWRFRTSSHHGLLGVRIHESTSLQPAWRNVLYLEDETWLSDHKIKDDVVFPFAGYCAMAGEALRQLTGTEAGYSLRNIRAHTAMVLKDSRPTEIITTLRYWKTSDRSTSDLWEFGISSYTGSTWQENCTGLVKTLTEHLLSSSHSGPLAREVQPSRWYKSIACTGIVYGPDFRGMKSIRAATNECLASASIECPDKYRDSMSFIHPTVIDNCFQLVMVALANGIGRKCATLTIPTMIKELDISKATETMSAWASAKNGNIEVQCGGENKAALRLSGFQLDDIDEDSTVTNPDSHAAARLEWLPHFDFVNHSLLFEAPGAKGAETKLLEEMTFLCMIDSAERLENLSAEKPHFEKYRQWLNAEVKRAAKHPHPILDNACGLFELRKSARTEYIEAVFTQLSNVSENDALAVGIGRIWGNIEAIFTGAADSLNLLLQDDVLTRIYNAVSFGHSGFIQLLSHSKPDLRILEVGAGTGGTTQTFLKNLIDAEGLPQYALYMFTDVSAGFFPMARERFSFAPNLDFKVFDISSDPFEQGFEAKSFDLILAPNVVHATPVLQNTLRNLRPLLKDDGRLVLTELACVAKTPNYIFGNFSGWWLGEDDERPTEPYVPVERWDRELREAGFTGADTVVYDAEYPYQYCAVIVAQAKHTQAAMAAGQSLTVLSNEWEHEPARALIAGLRDTGYTVSVHKLGTDLPQAQDILSLLDYEGDFLANVSEGAFTAFQKMLHNQDSGKLLWLTNPAQLDCQHPQTAMSIGIAKSIRAELSNQCVTFEIDPTEPSFVESTISVLRHIQSSQDTQLLLPDKEFAFHEGTVKIGRYHTYSLKKELDTVTDDGENMIKVLEIGKSGLPEALSWIERPAKRPIGSDEVEVETYAIGLSHLDVMHAQGNLSSIDAPRKFGMEAAGRISNVGADVSHLAVGELVMALSEDGCAATRVIVPASLVVRLPDALKPAEAATMPLCYTTAIQALIVQGQLKAGQVVLIHSAAGGVGLAAIRVCEMIGAEIFATVGSPDKLQYLVETLSIPKERIFDSRNDSFVRETLHATKGQGVDIVLNSLSGELRRASWRCVADFGTLIDLREQDHGKLDANTALGNKSYCCIDMIQLIRKRRSAVEKLLQKLLDGYRKGHLSPIRCSAWVEANEASQAFVAFQQGTLIGKAVIKMPLDTTEVTATKRAKPLELDPQASYLLTGGLGGLGKSLATWMVERGARSLVFLSPHAGNSSGDKAFIAELESMGCSVNAVQGRVEVMDGVRRALDAEKPIKGVIHLAMVLRDAPVTSMSYADWNAAVAPKVKGAWNLHDAFGSQSLDFFVLASTLFTVIERPGQCNYIAGNTFLEAFCQYRRRHNVPASVVNISPMEQIGFINENPQIRRKLKATGHYFLREQHLLDFFELAILRPNPSVMKSTNDSCDSRWRPWHSEGQFIMGLRSELPLEDQSNRVEWRRDRRMALYHNVRPADVSLSTSAASNELSAFLTRAADDTATLTDEAGVRFLGETIGRKILELTLHSEKEVALNLTVEQLGLDSLTATELRRWWKQAFGLDISGLEIMAAGTLGQLGETASKSLKAKMEDAK
ncbi:MAG: hypothetical protein Q9165_003547 [Trypethelium subeluteriae]